MQEPGSETGAFPGALSLSHARSLRRRYRPAPAQPELRAPRSPQCRFPGSVNGGPNYSPKNFSKKRFIRFTFCAVLSSTMKSFTAHPGGEASLCPEDPCCLRHLPFSHLVTVSVIGSAVPG